MAQISLSKMPWYGQVGLFLGLSLASLAAFYYFHVTSAQADFAARETKLAALRGDIQKAQTIGRRLPEFQAEVKELEARLTSLKPILPESKDYGELLRRIEDLARQSNITLKGVKPLPTVAQQLHTEWPVGLEIEGTYHNLGAFFDKISAFPRIIHITNLTIKAKQPPTVNASIDADFTAKTFVLLEAAPAAAGAKPQ